MTEPPRYVMIGGFLGAGKTTAVARLARRLTDRGLRAGLICNDQSQGLVDTTLLRAHGFAVEEITGGCFCCRFGSLLEAAEGLSRTAAPDVFLAEPVGSCTDLVATVSYPLRRIYGDRFTVAPLSVMVDPGRAARILGLVDGRAFSDTVQYVYLKQLQEADLIVVNKCDTQDPSLLERLEAALRDRFGTPTYVCSARDGTGVDPWFEAVLAPTVSSSRVLEIDYDAYADGERQLGWLNCTVRLEADQPFDGTQTLVELARGIRDRLSATEIEIAHLKMTFDAQDGTGTLSAVSLVGTDEEPDVREALLDRVERGELVLNLRAEADPAELERAMRAALAAFAPVRANVEHLEQLRPGRPVPTHRMA